MDQNHENQDLQADFAAAVADPQGFDFAFVEQRRETEFANFGFDPAKAKALRNAEIARIDADLDLEDDDDFDDDLDDEVIDDDEDDDDWEPFPDDFDDDDMEDEDEYDRYADRLGDLDDDEP